MRRRRHPVAVYRVIDEAELLGEDYAEPESLAPSAADGSRSPVAGLAESTLAAKRLIFAVGAQVPRRYLFVSVFVGVPLVTAVLALDAPSKPRAGRPLLPRRAMAELYSVALPRLQEHRAIATADASQVRSDRKRAVAVRENHGARAASTASLRASSVAMTVAMPSGSPAQEFGFER